MIPIRLHLSNFMSYRNATVVDFSNVRTACLSGENGAGKSALLEAMTWAIWGKSRASSGRDVVTIGESQVEVTFDFQLADRLYRVFRRQSVGARTSTTLEFYVRSTDSDDETEWHAITGDSTRETERTIVETLRLDYDTFVNSAFLMQGQADAFTEKAPGERKKVLANILNLGDYDVLATASRERERTLRARTQHLTGQIDRIDARLTARPQVEHELEQLGAQMIEASNAVERLEAETQAIQEALSAMAALLQSMESTTQRLQRQRSNLSELVNAQQVDHRALSAVAGLIARGEAIEADFASLLKWREAANHQADLLRQRQPLDARLRELERTVERERNIQQRRIDSLGHEITQIEHQLATITRAESELTALTGSLEKSGDLASDLQAARQALRDAESEKVRLDAECHALKSAMNDIKANMELLETGNAECPICRRPISDGEHKHVEELWRNEGTSLGNSFRANRDRIRELDVQIPESVARIERLEKLQTEIAEKQSTVRRLQTEIAARQQIESDLGEKRAQLATEQKQLDQRIVAAKQEAEIRTITQELEKLQYDSDVATQAEQEMRRLQRAEQEHAELQTSRIRHSHLQDAIENRTRRINELESDISTMETELAQMQAQLADEPALRSKFNERSDDLQRVRAERDRVQAQFGSVTGQMMELDALADEVNELRAERENVLFDADAYRELTLAFGRNGIQAMIVETILPELEDEANRLLARMTSSHLQVRFRSTRQAISNDNIIETLDIVIRDETGERPYALYSGGEAFRVDFAIRVALSKLLARRAGTTIDMLIIDEGFGTQDARGRDGLIEALRSVEEDFATILVITHIDDVRDMFPTRIEVTKTEAGSSVAVA